MNRKILDIFLICFFILLAVAFVVSYNFYTSEGSKCLDDPLGYAQKITNTSCGCYGNGEINAAFYCARECSPTPFGVNLSEIEG